MVCSALVRCALVLTALVIADASLLAQNKLGIDDRDEVIRKLLERVDVLEREVAALRQSAAPPAVAEPAQPAVAANHEASTTSVGENPEREEPRFSFHGYADAGFLRNQGGASDKRFAMGEVDLFASERISPRVNVLIEAVLETDNQLAVASVPVNVERLLLQYRANDYFNLDIGSYRTSIGFYNSLLRGSWLQTALTRPKLFTFEDDGGFLPLHNVGISANGKIPSGDLGLHYVAEVGSSRNYAQAGRTGLNFEDNAAVNVAVYARPRAVTGLQIGVSLYHDRFSPLPGFDVSRSVWAAHVVYQAHRFEFLNEGVLATFRKPGQGEGKLPGFYSQLAYRTGSNWTPYFRFDYANVYGRGSIGQYAPQYLSWRNAATAGVRYDLSESAALKFEVGHDTARMQPGWIQAAVQLAFTF